MTGQTFKTELSPQLDLQSPDKSQIMEESDSVQLSDSEAEYLTDSSVKHLDLDPGDTVVT